MIDKLEGFLSPHIPKEYELVAVEWEKRGTDWVLSVLIDKENEEVTIDETAVLSEIISPLLDQIKPDPFPKEGYLLEVASAGAERPLRKTEDFQKVIGEYVFVSLYQKIQGQKEFFGDLIRADGETIQIEYAAKSVKKLVEIPLNVIAKAQTMVKI